MDCNHKRSIAWAALPPILLLFGLAFPRTAQAVDVVSDLFTESSDVKLTAHTPDTGTGWTEVYTSAASGAEVIAATDIVRAGVNTNSVGQAYTGQPAPADVDQDLTITLKALDTTSGTKPVGLFGRRTDNDDFYHVQILPNSNSKASVKLFKFESASATELGAFDATLAVGTVIKLEIRDATKKVYVDGVERISSTDNSLTSAGTWGIYFGNFNGAGDAGHTRTTWNLDNLQFVSPATAVELKTFTATQVADSVVMEWRTGWEVDNLGFHVYRDADGERIRVSPELIAGSALLVGGGTRLTAGHAYTWGDPAGLSTDHYWLEDVDLDGTRTWHGPVRVQPAASSPAPALAAASAVTLSQLGASVAVEIPVSASALPSSGQPALVRPASDAQSKVQRALAALAAVKLFVREEGWYRVDYAALVAAGLNPSANPRTLRLFADGQEQALLVRDGGNGRFDPGDSIEFYGQGVDTVWTDTRVYWLIELRRWGRRVPVYASLHARLQEAASFPVTVADPAHEVYFAALKNGETDNFFGPVVSAQPVERTLTLQAVADADAQLSVTLQGVTETAHEVAVSLNAIAVGTVTFSGQQEGTLSVPIPPAWLHEGDNTVTLTAIGGEGDVSDVSLIAAIQLTYGHAYTTTGDVFRSTAQGRRKVRLTGFSTPDIRVLDVTTPHRVEEVTGPVTRVGTGYAVTVRTRRAGSRDLLAFTPAGLRQPVAIEANSPSRWQTGKGAQVIVLSHGDFLESIEPWSVLREQQGWSVAVVDVADVYDEFSFGRKTPQALKDFLQYAHEHWQPTPSHVLLVGDASFDPRNYLRFGPADFMPTKLVDTAFLETAWDDWLGDFDLDGVSELALGRLPVRTPAEADTIIAKLVQYGQTRGPWQQKVLLVADNQDGQEATDFAGMSSDVEALVPPQVQVKHVVLAQNRNTSRAALLNHLNSGQLVVNYVGHGSVDVWAGEELLTAADVYGLHNAARLPLVVTLNCLNGFFHDVYTESLAEAWLKAPHGGAIGVWASSGLTSPGGQAVMNQALIEELFSGEGVTLGMAVQRAKAAVHSRDIRRTWILFGDPTLRLE